MTARHDRWADRWADITPPQLKDKTYVCRSCQRHARQPEEHCPRGAPVTVDGETIHVPCSVWPRTLEVAKVMAQRKEPTDCVFQGTVIVGDKTIEVTSILPAEVAEDLEMIGAELKVLRLDLGKKQQQELARRAAADMKDRTDQADALGRVMAQQYAEELAKVDPQLYREIKQVRQQQALALGGPLAETMSTQRQRMLEALKKIEGQRKEATEEQAEALGFDKNCLKNL
jgi:hypothetical protein